MDEAVETKFYFKQHKNRRREAQFAHFLRCSIGAELVAETYPLPTTLENRGLNISCMIPLVEREPYLPREKRGQLIQELKKLPSAVRVVTDAAQISCDIAIVTGNGIWYWEFHERQHRSLSVSRSTPIYSMDGSMIRIPRFVQRFLRDLWRMLYLPDFSIVWFDWFERNAETTVMTPTPGFREFAIPGKFNFRQFGENNDWYSLAISSDVANPVTGDLIKRPTTN